MSNTIVVKYQSSYIPRHSTKTAPTLNINDILIYLDNKAPYYLILLYIYSAFDTLDHNILCIGLNEIDIHGQVHSWCISYFVFRIPMYFVSSRTYSVKINS